MSSRHIPMTRQLFEERMAAALPGEKIIYHVGFLLWDRNFGINCLAVWNTQSAAWEAMEAGKVTLVQQKITDGIWKYIAVKKAPPHDKVMWMGCYDPR